MEGRQICGSNESRNPSAEEATGVPSALEPRWPAPLTLYKRHQKTHHHLQLHRQMAVHVRLLCHLLIMAAAPPQEQGLGRRG